MEQERWQEIQAIFDTVLASEPALREQTLRAACQNDEELEREVRALLAADAQAGDFWEAFSLPGVEKQEAQPKLQADFGPYQFQEKIGQGGMGIVYKVWDTRLERPVALKCLSPQLHLDERGRLRFVSEARAASRLDHPNICLIYDIGTTPDAQMYFTMPCYEGRSLKEIIAKGPMAVHDAVQLLLQVCAGLQAAHRQQIFHRDIKPDNIIVTHEGVAKILDFGVAKVSGVEITGSGVAIGTVAYMSPEQLRGDKVDHRTDIWSAGVVFYEMITGVRPFQGKTPYEIIYQVMNNQPDSIAAHNPHLPPLVDTILTRCLDHTLATRYPHVDSLTADLLQLQQAVAAISPALATLEAPIAAMPAARSSGAHGSSVSGSSLDALTISSITRELTKHIGPLASMLVKKAVASIADIDDLCAHLASHIPSAREQRRFLRTLKGDVLSSGGDSGSGQAAIVDTAVSFPPEQLAAIEAQLTRYIGPIARTLVRNKSRAAQSMESLCHNLADHLDNDEEREAFLDQFRTFW